MMLKDEKMTVVVNSCISNLDSTGGVSSNRMSCAAPQILVRNTRQQKVYSQTEMGSSNAAAYTYDEEFGVFTKKFQSAKKDTFTYLTESELFNELGRDSSSTTIL